MLIRGPRFDALLAGALAALFVFEGLTESGFDGKRPAGIAVGVVFAATLALRRSQPLVPMIAAVVAIEFANLVGPNALGDTAALLFAVLITIYSCGAHSSGRTTLVCAALVLAAIPFAATEPGQSTSPSDIAFFLVFFGGPFVVGRVMRRRRERDTEIELESEERTRAAIADERARIARELHDVVAHAVSVVVLQARGARRVLDPEQAEAREALDTIEHSAGEALTEMRRLLKLLREQDDDLMLTPQPTLQRVELLADRARAAGLPVTLDVDGPLDGLPPGIDVSAYRIVQEALTNALKHAGPACASVKIARSDDLLSIDVADDGRGAVNGSSGGGHGLIGMQERVALYGGTLEAGPTGSGFALRVRLPLEGAA